MRAFVGLPLPVDFCEGLEALAARLPMGRAVPAENMHVTLAFVGDAPEAALEDLHDVLAARSLPVPRLVSEGLGAFGGGKPRTLHLEIAPDAALSDLRRVVRAAAHEAGLVLPHERFHPHVTLRRFPGLVGADRAALEAFVMREGRFALPPIVPEAVVLYASTLTRAGSVHDRLATYPLTP